MFNYDDFKEKIFNPPKVNALNPDLVGPTLPPIPPFT
ncbi:exosporium leader peptide, partial [Bacillus sp. 5mfcol3.1]